MSHPLRAPAPAYEPPRQLSDPPRVDWGAVIAARDESGAQVCPLCGIRRWREPEHEEGCCHVCLAEFEAEAVEDLAALAGALA